MLITGNILYSNRKRTTLKKDQDYKILKYKKIKEKELFEYQKYDYF